jgi:hypothetical protein
VKKKKKQQHWLPQPLSRDNNSSATSSATVNL